MAISISSTVRKSCTPVVAELVRDADEMILRTRIMQAFEEHSSDFRFYRSVRVSASLKLETMFDQLMEEFSAMPKQLSASTMVLDQSGLFMIASGTQKPQYVTCQFEVWAASEKIARRTEFKIRDRLGPVLLTGPVFSLNWFFQSGAGIEHVAIDEKVDDILFDEAYPCLHEGVEAFIDKYLNSDESVLVLQGPPGTGKTRLIRGILGELSQRRNNYGQIIYTTDSRLLESDEIFVEFITSKADAFVVEDADQILKPRSDGNSEVHRFLNVADGVVRSQGRKVIFSTNLPNLGDLDEALVRPGRCFAHIYVRPLSSVEGNRLLAKICGSMSLSNTRLQSQKNASYRLADLYRIAEKMSLDPARCSEGADYVQSVTA